MNWYSWDFIPSIMSAVQEAIKSRFSSGLSICLYVWSCKIRNAFFVRPIEKCNAFAWLRRLYEKKHKGHIAFEPFSLTQMSIARMKSRTMEALRDDTCRESIESVGIWGNEENNKWNWKSEENRKWAEELMQVWNEWSKSWGEDKMVRLKSLL